MNCALLPDEGNLPLRSCLAAAPSFLRSEALIARAHY